MANPSNRNEFRTYILRKLGSDFHNVELSFEQIDDIIDESLLFFRKNVYDFSKDQAIILDTTSTVVDYTLDEDIFAVMDIIDRSVWQNFYIGFPTVGSRSDAEHQFIIGLGKLGREYNYLDVSIAYQNISLFNTMFVPRMTWNFNYNTSTLHFYDNPINDVNQLILFVNRFIDSNTDPTKLWSNDHLIDFVTAKAQIQWGQNLSKFDGLSLPGGGNLNYQRLIDEGKEELQAKKDFILENLYDPSIFSIHYG
jgi:hypothetical protein